MRSFFCTEVENGLALTQCTMEPYLSNAAAGMHQSHCTALMLHG